MLSNNPMTIRDYLARLDLPKDLSRHSRNGSMRPDAAGDPFTRLLTISLTRDDRVLAPPDRGLTAIDYLANPIPAQGHGQCQVAGHPPQTERTEATNADMQSRSGRYISSQAEIKNGPSGISKAVVKPSRHEENSSSSAPHDSFENQTIDGCIREAAEKYKVPPGLIRAVVKAESNFNINAVSVAGAQGLMQLMPGTAKELGVEDPFDIRQNIDGGTRYLRQMLDLFGGDIRQALSAYNAGPGNVIKYGGNVPFPETKQYVSRVLNTVERSV